MSSSLRRAFVASTILNSCSFHCKPIKKFLKIIFLIGTDQENVCDFWDKHKAFFKSV